MIINNYIILSKDEVYDHIIDRLTSIQRQGYVLTNALYHHNSHYEDAASICRNGILSLKDLNSRGIRHYDEDVLARFSNDSFHVNSNNAISLSVVGLTDLYRDELEYDPLNPYDVDFLIANDISACRNTINYGNEFLSYESIPTSKIKAVDIRLLELIRINKSKFNIQIIKNYNALLDIVREIKTRGLAIPLREMSDGKSNIIDVDEALKLPHIALKR